MILIDPDKVVEDFPAVRYVSARPRLDYDKPGHDLKIVEVHHNDQFAVSVRGMHRRFKFCSVIGRAVENCKSPFDEVAKAQHYGHDLHGAYGLGCGITSHKREKKTFAVLEMGQLIKFEGEYFKLVPANNDNVGLSKVEI